MSATHAQNRSGRIVRRCTTLFKFTATLGILASSLTALFAQNDALLPNANQPFPSKSAAISRPLEAPKTPTLRSELPSVPFTGVIETAQTGSNEPRPDTPATPPLPTDISSPSPAFVLPTANAETPAAQPLPAQAVPSAPPTVSSESPLPSAAPAALPENMVPPAPFPQSDSEGDSNRTNGQARPNGPRPGGPGRGPQPVQVVVVPGKSSENTESESASSDLTAEEKEAEALTDSQLRTPRLTFEFLVKSILKNDHETAAKALDFTDMPGTSAKEKKDYAYKLCTIINRISELDPKLIPNDENLPEYRYEPNPQYPPLLLIKKGNRFLLSPETIEKIGALYEQVRDTRPAAFANIPFLCDLADGWFKYQFGLRRIEWLFLGIVAIIGYLVGLIVSKVLYFLTISSFHLLSADLSECKISKKTWRPIGWLIMYTLWYLGILAAHVPPRVVELMGCPIQTLAILMFVVTALQLVDIMSVWGRKKFGATKSKVDEILIPLLARTGKIAIVIVGVIMVFQAFGFSALGIISGMGIGGIAIALAAQNTIANFFGSLTVLMDRPFVIGDWIVTSSIEGEVESVGLRSTRIRTFYNSLVTVPNNLLTTAIIDNMGRRHFRRYKTLLGVQYDTPPDRIESFCEGIRELILSYNFTRKDIFHVYANEFNSSSIDILLICFFLVPDTAAEYRSRSTLILDIMRLAERMDIRFAFPSQTIYNIKTTDRDYDDPLESSKDFGRENASAIIERRLAAEKTEGKAKVYGQADREASTLDELTESIGKKSDELRKKRSSFFRRAG